MDLGMGNVASAFASNPSYGDRGAYGSVKSAPWNGDIDERSVGRYCENRIDACWLDMQTSVYIDIMASCVFDGRMMERGKLMLRLSKDHYYILRRMGLRFGK